MSQMKKPTAVMKKAIKFAEQFDNKLTRHPGGFWAGPDPRGSYSEYFGTPTMAGLVDRGLAEYSEFKQGRKHTFPIQIIIK